jgi:restriction system protein
MAVWIVRSGSHGETEDLALERGLTVIGWSDWPDLSTIGTREQLEVLGRHTYPDSKPGAIAGTVGQLWAFAHRITEGDLVVMPLKHRPAVAIGRITGPYSYRPEPDLPPDAYHTRSVHWLYKDVPRAAFTNDPEIRLSLNGMLTVYQIQRERADQRILAAAGETAIVAPSKGGEASGEPQPSLDLEEYARDQMRVYIARNFHSHDLAHLVDAVLKAQGYQTSVSPPGPDGGVDIIAGRGPLGFDPPLLCVQVKSSDQPIDVHPWRELQGVMSGFGAKQGLFVSWGGFNQAVRKDERRKFFEIRQWDADDLINAVLEHYEQLPADIQAELPLKRIWVLVQEES